MTLLDRIAKSVYNKEKWSELEPGNKLIMTIMIILFPFELVFLVGILFSWL